MENNKFNFRDEFNSIPACNQKKAKAEIMEALNITTPMGFHKRLTGCNNSNQAEQDRIKEIIIKNRDVQIELKF